MKALLIAACLVTSSVAVVSTATACEGEGHAAASPAIVTPEQVNTMLASGAVTPVDANNAGTRTNFGVLPGAILLTSHEFGDGELPADHEAALVFYCGSEACTAAPSAAEAALEQGYKNVSVMSAGIRGWVAAGYETTPVPGSDS